MLDGTVPAWCQWSAKKFWLLLHNTVSPTNRRMKDFKHTLIYGQRAFTFFSLTAKAYLVKTNSQKLLLFKKETEYLSLIYLALAGILPVIKIHSPMCKKIIFFLYFIQCSHSFVNSRDQILYFDIQWNITPLQSFPKENTRIRNPRKSCLFFK